MVAVAAGLLLVAGCGDASGSGSGGSGGDEDEPPIEGVELEAGDEDADDVTADIEALLDDYSRTVSAIVADPAVVDDPGDPLVRDYVALFEPDSQIVADALAGWARMAPDGTSIRPINADHPAVVTRLDGDVEAVGDDEVRFPTCDEHRYVTYDAQGAPTDVVERALQHGEGVAVSTGDGWQLRDLRNVSDGEGCQTAGDSRSEQ